MRTTVMVAVPESPEGPPATPPEGGWPLLVLLHGLSGNHMQWPSHVDVQTLASRRGMVIAMPDGARSFWVDAVHGLSWGTWVGSELPQLVRNMLRVSTSREHTMVGGLSMGGYGAAHAALDHPEVFGAAFSLSGTLDVTETAFQGRHPDLFEYYLGGYDVAGGPHDLVSRIAAGEGRDLRLFAACGSQDRLIDQNHRFRDVAGEVGLPLRWEEGPGNHDFAFWAPWLPRALEALGAPDTPDSSDVPDVPDVPGVPGVPDASGAPGTPGAPGTE